MRKNILKVLIVTLIISAILGISIIFFGLWGEVSGKILLTTSTIFGFSIPGLSCSTIYEKKGKEKFAKLGIIICILSCLYILFIIWGLFRFYEITLKLLVAGILLSSSFGHLSLLMMNENKDNKVSIFRETTIFLSIIIDILFLLMIFLEIDVSWKIVAILSILIALGTIVTPVLSKINSGKKVTVDDKYKQLEQLKKLLDSNAITEDEYNIEKNKVLNEK
ncbi:MAG: SHOCT domain-containing protein [Firmicutes bacterium]|nr:SHOCT domain-containing protein [Bacillota bacterium]